LLEYRRCSLEPVGRDLCVLSRPTGRTHCLEQNGTMQGSNRFSSRRLLSFWLTYAQRFFCAIGSGSRTADDETRGPLGITTATRW